MTDPGALHARGVAATARGAPAVGATFLREGLRLLGWPGRPSDEPLAGRLLISLAHAEAEQGRLDTGIALLESAAAFIADADRGIAEQQRGLLLLRAGRFNEARSCLDVALPLLAVGAYRDIEARALLNRGVTLQMTGHIAAARGDFRRCVDIARRAGLNRLAIKAEHNAGCCDFLTGDIPAALRAYANAEHALASEPGLVGVVLVDRARAVLAAGLVREAARDLDRAIALFAHQRLRQDQAEAELARAHTSLAAGDDNSAIVWSRKARTRFLRRGNTTGAALADLALLRVHLHTSPRHRGLVASARKLAVTLDDAGLPDDADLATLIGVRALIARGDYATAGEMYARGPRPRHSAPVEVRLIGRLAAAELAVAAGAPGAASRHVNAGLAMLQTHRSRFGSLDLQVGMLSPAIELAALGIHLAWQTGSAARCYSSTENARAQSLRIRSVRPAPEDRLVAAMAELRQLRREQRQAALAGSQPAPSLRVRLTELERLVRRRDWETDGSKQTDKIAALRVVVEQLSRAGAIMISLVSHGDRLGAVVIAPMNRPKITIVELGDRISLMEAVQRIRGDVDVLASQHLPERLERAVRGSLQASVAVIDERLAGIEAAVDADTSGGLVIVPTDAFSVLPWGCLPGLRGRAVTVAPSATSWARARIEDPGSTLEAPRRVVIVGGPDLAAAVPEVSAIAAEYDSPQVISGQAATVQATLQAIDGADIVHVAAHGEHDPDNGLFSRIWLADGPLMAYDLQHLRKAPRHVVLAACDVGRAAVHPGDDLLGLASAFLHAGTTTVTASVARVPDDVALRVMSEYHRCFAKGHAPAEALGRALARDPLAPFVCFGSA